MTATVPPSFLAALVPLDFFLGHSDNASREIGHALKRRGLRLGGRNRGFTEPSSVLRRNVSVDLLRAAITASGLSVPRFAREALGRHPRTVWRWLAGDTIPEVVVELLRQIAKVSKESV